MRDRPIFDSSRPDEVELTVEERAEVDARLARLKVLRAGEGEIPDMTVRPRLPE